MKLEYYRASLLHMSMLWLLYLDYYSDYYSNYFMVALVQCHLIYVYAFSKRKIPGFLEEAKVCIVRGIPDRHTTEQ